MSDHIEFYFDIISPYAYIAHKKIQKIKEINNIKFIYKPILLGGLHNLAKITAPAFNEYKMKNMRNDCELISKKNHINFFWNLRFPINSLNMMRGYLFVDKEKKKNYLDIFFKAYWNDNTDLSKEGEFLKLLKNLEIYQEKFISGIKNKSIKDELKELTNDAFKKEIFGAPTFIVNDKIFWGQDRLEYALEELNSN
jgi:2-hydroxychromene-2-carboxylate isomerase